MQPVQPLLQGPAGDAPAAQIHQHQVVVRAAGNQIKALRFHSLRQGGGVFHGAPGIVGKLRLHSLPETHGLAGDDVEQRPPLHPGKHGAVDLLCPFLPGQDHAASGAPEGLVGGGGHHIGIGHGVHVLSARHQTGNVGHVHQQRSAVPVGDVGKGFEIQGSGIGRSPRHQHPGTIPAHDVLHPVVVNAPRFGLHPVADGPVYLSRLVHHRPVGQVAAAGEIHAHQGVPRLQQGHKGRQIGLGTGMGLHIGVLRAEELFHPVNGQPLDLVHILAPAVVPPAGVALGILVGQAAAHGGHHRGGGDVLRGDKLDIFLLAAVLPLQPGAHLPVLVSQIVHAFLQKIFQAVFSIFQMFC